MAAAILVFIKALIFSYLFTVAARTANNDFLALNTLRSEWQNTPPSWLQSDDPCGDPDLWVGIQCKEGRVSAITLPSMGLVGQLTSEIASLPELEILDLSYNANLSGTLPVEIGNLTKLIYLSLINCSFYGRIPDSIGNLKRLKHLALNSNKFNGEIPPAIGTLSSIDWLDLADNQLQGQIPISNATSPGLDMLQRTHHFHFGQNQLSGPIPPQLFSSNMSLIHALFESNKFEGSIPSTVGLAQQLQVVRFDDNYLTQSVPPNITQLTNLLVLFLSNNRLTGPIPDLTGLNALNYLDLSNNNFDQSDFPSWLSTLQPLTTVILEKTNLQGQIPTSFFSLDQLQTVVLRNNNLNGTLDIGTTISNQLERIDLDTNLIDKFNPLVDISNVDIILVNNPVCKGSTEAYCSTAQPNVPPITPPNNCAPVSCFQDQTLSPSCKCAYPYTGTFTLRATTFSGLGNQSMFKNLEYYLAQAFQSYGVPVDTVNISNPIRNAINYLYLSIAIFPSGADRFNRTSISNIALSFSNQIVSPPPIFGPCIFNPDDYGHYSNDIVLQSPAAGSSKSSNTGIIAGAAAGGSALLLLLFLASAYAFHQKKKARRLTRKNTSFEEWDPDESNASVPVLKGARRFTFEEIQNYTKNFSQVNTIGSGGYGKVFRGTLPNGQLIAVKRAQKESMQGGLEFKTEIELLSRVHHKNLVSLLGFCFEQGEQMLIYEYVANGTLKDTLSGRSGIRLDWIRRLKIALGAARGLDYLHELANPPIIHRDIKSTNILLDEHLNAKVSDFGLSKPLGDGAKGYITTQVKGTMGYLDPEYYMTQQLTEKSDVYSFGVLMLELITARRPIERGKYIVKVVKSALDKEKELCGLKEIIDPTMGLGTALPGFDKFVDLAMHCVEESSSDRPSMNNVVKEIENMLQLAGSNPNVESATTSSSYIDVSKGSSRHPYDNESFDASLVIPRA